MHAWLYTYKCLFLLLSTTFLRRGHSPNLNFILGLDGLVSEPQRQCYRCAWPQLASYMGAGDACLSHFPSSVNHVFGNMPRLSGSVIFFPLPIYKNSSWQLFEVRSYCAFNLSKSTFLQLKCVVHRIDYF